MERTQYFPVVLEIGSRIVRAGFAGESAPVVTLRVDDYTSSDYSPHIQTLELLKPCFLTDPPEKVQECYHYDASKKKWLFNNDFRAHQFLEPIHPATEESLFGLVSHVYDECLLVDPKRCKVIVPVPVLMPQHIRRTIANVLLDQIHAQSAIFLPEAILTVVGAGVECGLVVDIGWEQTLVCVVYDRRLLYKSTRFTSRAAQALHYRVLEMFLKNGAHSDDMDQLFKTVERFIHESVYCKPRTGELEEGLFTFEGITLPRQSRHAILEDLFFPQGDDGDDDDQPLVNLILSVIHGLPIDLRGAVSKRVIFTGIINDIPGLKTRIMNELREQNTVGSLKFRLVVSLGVWAGASLYCSTRLMGSSSGMKSLELLRDNYLQSKKLIPDWIDRLYELPLGL